MEIIIIIISLGIIFTLAYGHTRLINLNKNTVYNESKFMQQLYKKLRKLNIETELLITMFEFLIASVAVELCLNFFEHYLMIIFEGKTTFLVIKYLSILILTILATYITMIIGKYIPKHLVHMRKKHKFNDMFIMYIYNFLTYTFYPITILSTWLDSIVRDKVDTDSEISGLDEVKEFTNKELEKGNITKVEKELIEKVVTTLDKPLSKICTKNENVIKAKSTDEISSIIRKFAKSGVTRILLYGKNNLLLGYIHIDDVLTHEKSLKSGTKNIEKLVKQPIILSDNETGQKAYAKMRTEKISFGIVKDENENILGIVTMGDIANELLGSRNEG